MNLTGQDVTNAFVAYHPATTWKHLNDFFIGYLPDYHVSDVSKDFRRLISEFTKVGLFDKKGHGVYITMCSIVVMIMTSLCGVSSWLGHDFGHYQIMSSREYNRFAQVLTGNCLSGISIAWWKWNHNAHHISCNIFEFDPDLQHMPFFAVSSSLFSSLRSYFYEMKMNFDVVTRFLVSYQHWIFYPVMCLARLNLFAQSFVLLSSKCSVPNRIQEIIGILVFWIWFPFVVSFLPNLGERVMFVLASFTVTGVQHVQFCLNHFTSSVYVGPPIGNNWFENQMKGTLDITCPSWMDWFHGGLQYQIEHHLFPRLPRCNLKKISPYVKELCKKHNLPYLSVFFLEANVLMIGTLRTAALQARDITNPIPKNL
ncbi:hypothetical protein GIB67_042085 [Kingdonia uniflora]|uniref:Fatty acid desaturase domain-containing protein n=1 Tax=Kingdonia uniflora TaxID=39325 RepID=A0A7J7MVY4_9MAGN|nr:hypothetical protein GIB67_042085 [Kingdonia uniflora]